MMRIDWKDVLLGRIERMAHLLRSDHPDWLRAREAVLIEQASLRMFGEEALAEARREIGWQRSRETKATGEEE